MKPLTTPPRPSAIATIARAARRLLPAVVVAALATAAYVGWKQWRGGPTPITYTTEAARTGDVIQAVTASGTLAPSIQVDVGSQVSGRIKEVLVDFNDHVTAGQVLARIDSQVLAGQVAQARARLSSARAELDRARAQADNARTSYRRLVSLLESGAVSQSEVDTARAAHRTADASIQTAKASIVEAQASLDNAQTNLTYTTITSPIDGVVIARTIDVGQTVAASLQAPTLFTLAGDLRAMEVHTSVAESDVGQLAEGGKVEFTVDAYPERTFTGTVKQVRNQATTVSSVVTYDAVIEVANPDLVLRPGMTANATFVIAERRDVLVVPSKALRYRPASATARRPATAGGGRNDRTAAREWSRTGARPDRERRAPAPVEGTAGSSAGTPAATAAAETPAEATAGTPAEATAETASADAPFTGRRGRRGRGAAVWVLRDGAPVRVRVRTGLTDGSLIEITGGDLQIGDPVITADSSVRAPGASTGSNRRNGRSGGFRSHSPF